jgi:hypothetical protein
VVWLPLDSTTKYFVKARPRKGPGLYFVLLKDEERVDMEYAHDTHLEE